MLSIFSCAQLQSVGLPWRNTHFNLGSLCSWVVFIFDIELLELLVYFGDEFPVGVFIANLSSCSEGCACLMLRVSFGRQVVLRLMRVYFSLF